MTTVSITAWRQDPHPLDSGKGFLEGDGSIYVRDLYIENDTKGGMNLTLVNRWLCRPSFDKEHQHFFMFCEPAPETDDQ